MLYVKYTGLVSLEMPLSSDPVLGSWMIKVLYGSKEIKQSFKVDEYGKNAFLYNTVMYLEIPYKVSEL
jgi:uncharacterized protein YfaS (alpha-2-macroglobulin family)